MPLEVNKVQGFNTKGRDGNWIGAKLPSKELRKLTENFAGVRFKQATRLGTLLRSFVNKTGAGHGNCSGWARQKRVATRKPLML